MRLYLIKPRKDLPLSDNPWRAVFEKYHAFVIRAKNENEAREIAHQYDTNGETRGYWLDEKYTACVELTNVGEPGVVIADYVNG